MATNYARGANFERRVKADLEKRGYIVVRSAGSHSPIDLMAYDGDELLLVQCKRNGWGSPAERANLLYLAQRYWCSAILASLSDSGIQYRLYTGSKKHEPWGE